MKIVAQSSTELIIRDSALAVRTIGGILAAIGAFAVALGFTADPDGRVATVPVVIGSVLVAGGLMLVILPARKTFAFSRAERLFVIAKERFGRVERRAIALDQITDVTLEESASSEGGSTYRISVTLADQRRIPWTSYYSSGFASKQAVVALVRQFLRLDPVPELGSEATSATTERTVRQGRGGLIVMGAFLSIFLGIGAAMLVKEQRRLSDYQPVTATVLSKRVATHRNSRRRTYEPVVVYRYRVQDREYTASRVTPLEESRSGNWARKVTSRYQVGREYTAYYDPANPGEAFLLRTRSVIPWAFLGIPLIGLLIIGAVYRGTNGTTRLAYRTRSFG